LSAEVLQGLKPSSIRACFIVALKRCATQKASREISRAAFPAALFLFEPFDQVQIGQHAVVAEDAGLGVGGHEDGADGFNAGGIGGD